MNRRIEVLLIVAGVAYVAGYTGSYYLQIHGPNLLIEGGMDPAKLGIFNALSRLLATVPIGLVCGFWLASEAKREERSPAAWFFFGLIFQVVGIALFYAVTILDEIRGTANNKGPFEP